MNYSVDWDGPGERDSDPPCGACHKNERETRALRTFVQSIADAKLDLRGIDARDALIIIQKRAKAALNR